MGKKIKKKNLVYTIIKKKKKKLEKIYEKTLNKIEKYKVIKGTIIEINKKSIIVNIDFKSDGLIQISEFKNTSNLEIGNEIDVYVEEQENKKGELILSYKKAKLVKG